MAGGLTRKRFLQLGAGAVGAAGLTGILAARQAPGVTTGRRPNILFITTDQERARADLPGDLALPNHDRLAGRGVTFPAFHVNAVACGPARGVIYTGQHLQRTRVYDNPTNTGAVDLDPKRTPTIGHMLQQQGYYTAYKGKWHLSLVNRLKLDDYTPALRPFGFDEFQPFKDTYGRDHGGYKLDPVISGMAAEWLGGRGREIAREQPWCLAVTLIHPHDSMFFDATGRRAESRLFKDYLPGPVGRPDDDLYRDLGYDLPPTFPGDLATRPAVHTGYVEDALYVYGDLPIGDREAWRRYQNYYFNCCQDVDRHIGTVLDALEKSGQAADTIVVYTGDHGEMAGAHGHRLKGAFVFKENVQVPLVIGHPDGAAGKATAALGCSVDLAPTLLSLAGVGADERAERYPALKGYDLSGSVSDPAAAGARDRGAGAILLNYSAVFPTNPKPKRRNVLKLREAQEKGIEAEIRFPGDTVQFDLRSFYRGLYDGRYRFARYFRPGEHHRPEDWETLNRKNDLELYDTRSDPLETDNLAHKPEPHRDLILDLNARVNALIDREVGLDDGSHLPGPPETWKLQA